MAHGSHQNFTQISYGQLRHQLENLCERYGIRYLEQEESTFNELDIDVIVDPAYQGRGLGRQIKARCVEPLFGTRLVLYSSLCGRRSGWFL